MRKEVKLLAGTAVVLVIAMAVAASFYSRSQKQAQVATAAKLPPATGAPFIRAHSPTLGPTDAKVTLVEFLDPECETCRVMSPIVKHLMEQYKGKIRLVVRYMALHGNSIHAVGALEAAAGQGKYWEMLDALFARQPEWGDHHDPKPQLIPEIAKQVGVDVPPFDPAAIVPSAKQKVDIDLADARQLGVTGTPTFFVNGKMLERLGAEPLKAAIDEALAAP